MKTKTGLISLLFSAALLVAGCDGAVTTNAPPPSAPGGLSVTAASSTELSVSWTAPAGGAVSGYKLYRDGTFLKAISATAASDTGLSPATRYCYTVTAYNAAGAESPSSESVCGTTLSSDTTGDTEAPSVPADLAATAASSTEISLAWSASTDNTGVAGYNLYRDGSYLKSVTVAAASDTGLLPSTRYCYTVSAFDAAGNESGKSAEACATTQAAQPGTDETPPTAPSNLVSTAVTTASISVSWTAATDNVGVAGYKIRRDGLFLKAVTETASTDTGLAAGTQYCYTVSAGDAAGNESTESAQSCATTLTDQPADTAAPSVPESLAAAAGSATSIDLNWSVSTDNVSVAGYKIYRDSAYLKSVTATTASDTGLLSSTQYCYEVSAYDAAGNESARTGQVCATTQAPPDTTAPTIAATSPGNGSTNIARNAAITATFSEAMKSSTIDTTSFKVEYGSGSGVSGTVSYNAATKTATFTPSSNLAYSTVYTARVTNKVEDEVGNKMESNYTWSFTTTAAPDTTGPSVSSTNPANNATGTAINGVITATFSEAMDATTINTSTFTVAGVGGSASYNSETRTATFAPSTSLAYSQTYTVTITTGVKDSVGNSMASDYRFSFTTAADPTLWMLPVDSHARGIVVDTSGNTSVSGVIGPSGAWHAFFSVFDTAGKLKCVVQKGNNSSISGTGLWGLSGSGNEFFMQWGDSSSHISSFDSNCAELSTLAAPISSSITSSNGAVYFGTSDGRVVKQNSVSGASEWEYIPSFGGGASFGKSVVINGKIFAIGSTTGAATGFINAGGSDVVVVRLDTATGAVEKVVQWGSVCSETGYGIGWDASGIYVAMGTDCVGGNWAPHYMVKKYDFDLSPTPLWTADLTQFSGFPLNIAVGVSFTYVVGDDGLVKLDNVTGAFQGSVPGEGMKSIAIFEDILLVTRDTYKVYRYRADTLELIP